VGKLGSRLLNRLQPLTVLEFNHGRNFRAPSGRDSLWDRSKNISCQPPILPIKSGHLMTMLPSDYPSLLEHRKTQIRQARTRAAWDDKVLEQLSKDLRLELPDMQGFSPQNLK
jgi:hypothetical protein